MQKLDNGRSTYHLQNIKISNEASWRKHFRKQITKILSNKENSYNNRHVLRHTSHNVWDIKIKWNKSLSLRSTAQSYDTVNPLTESKISKETTAGNYIIYWMKTYRTVQWIFENTAYSRGSKIKFNEGPNIIITGAQEPNVFEKIQFINNRKQVCWK